MNAVKQHYMGSIYFSIVSMVLGFAYGMYAFGGLLGGLNTMALVAMLSVIEVSLSFDNSIANAKVLADMDAVWRRRFVTYGMLFAIGFMRLLFPLLIVSLTVGIGMLDTLNMALNDQDRYAMSLDNAHPMIVGFGGAFLMLVGLNFFLNEEKETHWFGALETRLQMLGSALGASITLLVLLGFYKWAVPMEERDAFLISGLLGIVVHEIIGRISDSMGSTDDLSVSVAKSGFASFLYLELLDSMFSADSTIAAMAISTNIFVIALGLGVGAMFVRSMTLHLVDSGTLNEFKYLEHGAFYSILLLSIVMFVSTVMEVPEIFTGTASVVIIAVATLHSKYAKE